MSTARSSNDGVILNHRLAMRQRALTAAKFIATRKRKFWTVEELAKVIYTAWEGGSARA
jgi:hypothetical protein